MKPTGKNIYKKHLQEDLHRKALVMERTLLLIAPISVLVLLNGVFMFRAFIDWAFLKKDFLTNPNFPFIGVLLVRYTGFDCVSLYLSYISHC